MRNYRWWLVFSKRAMLAWLTWLLAMPAGAVVNADRTRVVFNSDDIVQSLTLVNQGAQPALVQVWTDSGNPLSSPDESDSPVVALPPIFKIMPAEIRTLKLMLSTRQTLQRDRENLFWLNLYQIPPNTQLQSQSDKQVVLPLRLRLKLLVRPTGIGAPAESDGEKLHFSPQGMTLRVDNPTPWYMTINIKLQGEADGINVMVPPRANVPVGLEKPPVIGQPFSWTVINDSGNYWVYQGILR